MYMARFSTKNSHDHHTFHLHIPCGLTDISVCSYSV